MLRARISLAGAVDSYSSRHRVFSSSGTSRCDGARSMAERDNVRVVFAGSQRRSQAAGGAGPGSRLRVHRDSQPQRGEVVLDRGQRCRSS